jgi:hypothetical protein
MRSLQTISDTEYALCLTCKADKIESILRSGCTFTQKIYFLGDLTFKLFFPIEKPNHDYLSLEVISFGMKQNYFVTFTFIFDSPFPKTKAVFSIPFNQSSSSVIIPNFLQSSVLIKVAPTIHLKFTMYLQCKFNDSNEFPFKIFPVGLTEYSTPNYLNSILQVLFHTLQIRQHIINLSFKTHDGDELLLSQPLQKMFGLMQFGQVLPAGTIFNSCGWTKTFLLFAEPFHRFFYHFMRTVIRQLPEADEFKNLFLIESQTPKCKKLYNIQLNIKKSHNMGDSIQKHFKKKQYSTFPPILHICLKRSKHNKAHKNYSQFSHFIEFPEILDLATKHMKSIYKLNAVIAYQQSNPNQYFAFCRHHFTNEWFQFQDQCVSPVTETEVFANNFGGDSNPRCAYFLSYIADNFIVRNFPGELFLNIPPTLQSSIVELLTGQPDQKSELEFFSDRDLGDIVVDEGLIHSSIHSFKKLQLPRRASIDSVKNLLKKCDFTLSDFHFWSINDYGFPQSIIDQAATIEQISHNTQRIFITMSEPNKQNPQIPIIVATFYPLRIASIVCKPCNMTIKHILRRIGSFSDINLDQCPIYFTNDCRTVRSININETLLDQNIQFGMIICSVFQFTPTIIAFPGNIYHSHEICETLSFTSPKKYFKSVPMFKIVSVFSLSNPLQKLFSVQINTQEPISKFYSTLYSICELNADDFIIIFNDPQRNDLPNFNDYSNCSDKISDVLLNEVCYIQIFHNTKQFDLQSSFCLRFTIFDENFSFCKLNLVLFNQPISLNSITQSLLEKHIINSENKFIIYTSVESKILIPSNDEEIRPPPSDFIIQHFNNQHKSFVQTLLLKPTPNQRFQLFIETQFLFPLIENEIFSKFQIRLQSFSHFSPDNVTIGYRCDPLEPITPLPTDSSFDIYKFSHQPGFTLIVQLAPTSPNNFYMSNLYRSVYITESGNPREVAATFIIGTSQLEYLGCYSICGLFINYLFFRGIPKSNIWFIYKKDPLYKCTNNPFPDQLRCFPDEPFDILPVINSYCKLTETTSLSFNDFDQQIDFITDNPNIKYGFIVYVNHGRLDRLNFPDHPYLTAEHFDAVLRKLKPSQKYLFFIEACNSGAFISQFLKDGKLPLNNIAIITSTEYDQTCRTCKFVGNEAGIFTTFGACALRAALYALRSIPFTSPMTIEDFCNSLIQKNASGFFPRLFASEEMKNELIINFISRGNNNDFFTQINVQPPFRDDITIKEFHKFIFQALKQYSVPLYVIDNHRNLTPDEKTFYDNKLRGIVKSTWAEHDVSNNNALKRVDILELFRQIQNLHPGFGPYYYLEADDPEAFLKMEISKTYAAEIERFFQIPPDQNSYLSQLFQLSKTCPLEVFRNEMQHLYETYDNWINVSTDSIKTSNRKFKKIAYQQNFLFHAADFDPSNDTSNEYSSSDQ